MKEDFVTYDLAVKLKEKGFKEYCEHGYFLENGRDILYTPTIYQVLKWLREEKNLFVDITLCCAGYRGCICSTIIPEERDSPECWMFSGVYKTYELAAIEGIKCVLDNFI